MIPDDPDYYEVTNGLSRPLIKLGDSPASAFVALLLILAIIGGMALLIESVVAR